MRRASPTTVASPKHQLSAARELVISLRWEMFGDWGERTFCVCSFWEVRVGSFEEGSLALGP